MADTDDPARTPDESWTLSVGDVSRLIGVHTETISRWADEGQLPSVRTTGGHRRFRRSDVDDFVRGLHR